MDYIHSVRELIDMREVQGMDLSLSLAGFFTVPTARSASLFPCG